ncbi:hypothetical protein GCM10023080_020570 [Streptomyces pseudoechinosporeus]
MRESSTARAGHPWALPRIAALVLGLVAALLLQPQGATAEEPPTPGEPARAEHGKAYERSGTYMNPVTKGVVDRRRTSK